MNKLPLTAGTGSLLKVPIKVSVVRQGLPMTNSNAVQFWQYAEEATAVATLSKSEKEKEALIQLAHIWTQAALHSEGRFKQRAA